MYTKIANFLGDFKVIRRLIVLAYAIQVANISSWFMSLPDPTNAQSAFVSTMMATVPAMLGFYANSTVKGNLEDG